MRWKHFALFLLAIGLISPAILVGQPGGGRGPGGGGPGGGGPGGGSMFGGGGMSMDPDEMFNRWSGGKDVIKVSEMDSRRQSFMRMMGIQGDEITRDQVRQALQNSPLSGMMNRGGGGSTPGGGGSTPGGGRGPGGGMTFGGPGGGMTFGGPGGGGRGQDGPLSMEQEAERAFRQMDRNGDGFIAADEVSQQSQLRDPGTFAQYDVDRDNKISLSEYQKYFPTSKSGQQIQARLDAAKQGGNGQGGANQGQPDYMYEDERPVIFRFGKLPKEIPEWFIRLDMAGDVDGQVGLYEWVKDTKERRSIEEFQRLDTNGDGYITAEEYLRSKKKEDAKRGGSNSQANAQGQGQQGQGQGQQGQFPFPIPGLDGEVPFLPEGIPFPDPSQLPPLPNGIQFPPAPGNFQPPSFPGRGGPSAPGGDQGSSRFRGPGGGGAPPSAPGGGGPGSGRTRGPGGKN